LLACNPFYLVSAALLLFGFYRVSVDPGFLSEEISQLTFNFTSLQFYEALLVITAIFLARRRIWYDSTLLVSLENMFLFVPFILVSQAALIEQRMVWTMCLVGGLFAVVRFGGLKRFIGELNFPKPLVVVGFIILLVNVSLPVVYRILHQSKVGTRPDWGSAYYTNEFSWLLLMPLLCWFANLLPAPRGACDLPPQGRWLPLGIFSLWLVATGTHLYCLGYVYDFSLRPELLAPAVWALLWMLRRRMPEFLPAITPLKRKLFLVPPLLATFLAAEQRNKEVFLALTLLNFAIYGAIYLRARENRFVLHLVFLSLVSLVGGLPEDWCRAVVSEFSRARFIGFGAAGYVLLWASLARNPRFGIIGGVLISIATAFLLPERGYSLHFALQSGVVFLLLHSLRWVDSDHAGARVIRAMAAGIWVAHTLVWTSETGTVWMACAVGELVLAVYFSARLFSGSWGSRLIPLSAVLVALSGPTHFTAAKVGSAPSGLLAVAGSFVLFGLGTLVALTKHRWNKTEVRQ